MKIYEIETRRDTERWLASLDRRIVRGYSGPGLEYFAQSLDEPEHVPFLAFAVSGKTEGEVCMRLALVMQEYLDQHPGAAIRVRRDPTIDSFSDFDSMLPKWKASARLLCDKRLDEAEAERAKRAE